MAFSSAGITNLGNLGQFEDILRGKTSIQNLVDNFINRFTAAPENFGFEGFTLDFIEEETFSSVSNYSDEVLNNGTVISQHVVNEPNRYTIKGIVFDEVYNTPPLNEITNGIGNALGSIASYGLDIAAEAQEFVNRATAVVTSGISFADRLIQEGNDIANAIGFSGFVEKPRTEKMFATIEALKTQQQKLRVAIFGNLYENMYIEKSNVSRLTSKEGGKMQFNIEFKQLLTPQNPTYTLNQDDLNNFIKTQRQRQTNKGTSAGRVQDNATFLGRRSRSFF